MSEASAGRYWSTEEQRWIIPAPWIDRTAQEPDGTDPEACIIVWGDEENWPWGVVACCRRTGKWADVVDNVPVTFRYWMHAPDRPPELP